jgi:hypothetical protein
MCRQRAASDPPRGYPSYFFFSDEPVSRWFPNLETAGGILRQGIDAGGGYENYQDCCELQAAEIEFRGCLGGSCCVVVLGVFVSPDRHLGQRLGPVE